MNIFERTRKGLPFSIIKNFCTFLYSICFLLFKGAARLAQFFLAYCLKIYDGKFTSKEAGGSFFSEIHSTDVYELKFR